MHLVQADEFHHDVIVRQEAFLYRRHALMHVFQFAGDVLGKFLCTETDSRCLLETSLALLTGPLLAFTGSCLASKAFRDSHRSLHRAAFGIVSDIDVFSGFRFFAWFGRASLFDAKRRGSAKNLYSIDDEK
ncbi:unnamed protein product [Pseudo-nitzschia multistriata]|uniref:Uncharacterized protein n=1 Tax=Pseudo-nitzschia multistriata TaxID=183589 RepID=A0A448YYJ4_9STRA|nr:unnamed protein product [Pseudo-nitzschia multistriata]